MPENEANPADFVVRTIERRPVAGSIVRLRLRLSGEQSARVRDADLRAVLSPAHYVASISRDLTDEARRRLDAEPTDLQPLTALRMYLGKPGHQPATAADIAGTGGGVAGVYRGQRVAGPFGFARCRGV